MNENKLNELKRIAKRTLKILELLEQGLPPAEVALKAKADRQLVEYYKKILNVL